MNKRIIMVCALLIILLTMLIGTSMVATSAGACAGCSTCISECRGMPDCEQCCDNSGCGGMAGWAICKWGECPPDA